MSHPIDSLAYTNRLRWLPPGQKVAFALLLLLLSLICHPLVQGLISLWILLWVVGYANIPGKIYGRLLALPLGFCLTSLPAFILSGVSEAASQSVQWDVWRGWHIGSIYLYVSQTGLHQVGLLLPRTLATTSSMFFMLLTTPFIEVVQLLRRLRCPIILVELLLLMYRLIFTLLAIVDELWTAQHSRCGYRTWRRGMYSLAILVGQLLERALLSYHQMSLSLAARGFSGELGIWRSPPYKPSLRYSLEAAIGCVILVVLNLMLH